MVMIIIIIIIIIIIMMMMIIIITAVPGDSRIDKKEKEKLEKYQDLRREVPWLWRVNVTVTNVVVPAWGMVTKNLRRSLQQRQVSVRTEFLQKAEFLGTTRNWRKVLQA